MAINAKLVPANTYGVLEMNHVVAKKTGAIKAQHVLNATDFASIDAENGMLLVPDEVARETKLATADTDNVYLHFSTEKLYDKFADALNKFSVKVGTVAPRLYALAKGDTFTTNTVAYDTAVFADKAAITAAVATGLYGKVSLAAGYKGYIELAASADADAAVVLKAVKATTLPDGLTYALKFEVVKA